MTLRLFFRTKQNAIQYFLIMLIAIFSFFFSLPLIDWKIFLRACCNYLMKKIHYIEVYCYLCKEILDVYKHSPIVRIYPISSGFSIRNPEKKSSRILWKKYRVEIEFCPDFAQPNWKKYGMLTYIAHSNISQSKCIWF